MESSCSCVSTTSRSGESVAHNVWNTLIKLLFHGQICGVFEPFVDEIDLAKIALSCHFVTLHRAPLPVESSYWDSVASFPPDVPRDIPDETVKTLVCRLV